MSKFGFKLPIPLYPPCEDINEHDKIDIICIYDRLRKELFDIYFKPSFNKHLSKHFNLVEYYLDADENADGTFKSNHFCKFTTDRLDIIKDYISKNKSVNKWAIMSDVDVIFFANFYGVIKCFMDHKKDVNIFHMPEEISSNKYDVNGGFFIFRCVDENIDLFNTIQSVSRSMIHPNEQYATNGIFKSKNYKHDILDPKIFCTNNNSREITKLLLRTMRVFHATSSVNTMEKHNVLSSVYLLYERFNNKLNKKEEINSVLWID